MAVSKLFNLLTITTLALLAATFNATPVTALAPGHQHLNRQVHHEGVARRNRRATSSGRCKPRPSTSVSLVHANQATSPAAEPSSSKAPAPVTTSITLTTSTPPPPPPKTTSTKTPAPAPSPTQQSSGGSSSANGKIGIAWNGGNAASLGNLVSSNTHYIYTWSPWEPTNLFGLEFIPMLWGDSQINDFNKLVKPSYAHNALFVNEPNQKGQAQMSPQDAANLWQQQFQWRQDDGYSLWSPAVTNAPDGETWMDDFLSACSGCSVSYMALHFYDTDPQRLISYVQHWHSKYGKPIVITEFACQNFGGGAQASIDQVWAFYKTVIPWLISQDYVKAIFPFGFLEDMSNVNPANQLMKNGQLTDLGRYIVYGPY